MSLFSPPHVGILFLTEEGTTPRSQVANVPLRLWLQVRVWVLCDNDAQTGTAAPLRLQSLVSVIVVSRVCRGAQVRSFADTNG